MTETSLASLRSRIPVCRPDAMTRIRCENAKDLLEVGTDDDHGNPVFRQFVNDLGRSMIGRRRRFRASVRPARRQPGLRASHFAITTFCWFPPDISFAFWCPNPFTPKRAMFLSAKLRMFRAFTQPDFPTDSKFE